MTDTTHTPRIIPSVNRVIDISPGELVYIRTPDGEVTVYVGEFTMFEPDDKTDIGFGDGKMILVTRRAEALRKKGVGYAVSLQSYDDPALWESEDEAGGGDG